MVNILKFYIFAIIPFSFSFFSQEELREVVMGYSLSRPQKATGGRAAGGKKLCAHPRFSKIPIALQLVYNINPTLQS